MDDRETKARQCQTIERNILHWTKRWRIPAHNESRLEEVGSSDASSNALQNTGKEQWRTHRNLVKRKKKYACVVDADESTRPRLEGAGHKPHEDHITAKRDEFYDSLQSCAQIHCDASSILKKDAKAEVEKEWEKLKKIPAWQLTKVRNKKEVIDEANKGRKVHFASLMDLCHLKNSVLEPQYQEYKGRVVLRGDIVKDDSGSYAVFTEQGSSASHGHKLDASTMFRTSRRCSIRLYPGQNGRCINVIKNTTVRMSRYLDTSTEAQVAQIMVQCGRPSHYSRKESVRSSSGRTFLGMAIWESSIGTRLEKSF